MGPLYVARELLLLEVALELLLVEVALELLLVEVALELLDCRGIVTVIKETKSFS